jgi:hypothetical protein
VPRPVRSPLCNAQTPRKSRHRTRTVPRRLLANFNLTQVRAFGDTDTSWRPDKTSAMYRKLVALPQSCQGNEPEASECRTDEAVAAATFGLRAPVNTLGNGIGRFKMFRPLRSPAVIIVSRIGEGYDSPNQKSRIGNAVPDGTQERA